MLETVLGNSCTMFGKLAAAYVFLQLQVHLCELPLLLHMSILFLL